MQNDKDQSIIHHGVPNPGQRVTFWNVQMESTYILFLWGFLYTEVQSNDIHDFKKIEYISVIAIEPKPQKINYVCFSHKFGEVEWQKITQLRIWYSEN